MTTLLASLLAFVLTVVVVSALPPFDDFAFRQDLRTLPYKRAMPRTDTLRQLRNRPSNICRRSVWEPQVPCWSTLHEHEPLCIATVQLCDGVIDCPQSEDEWPLTCALLKNAARSRTYGGGVNRY